MNNCILFLISVLVFPAFGEFRIWEDAKGKTIEAEYISEQAGRIVLELRNGKTIRINPETLSEKDRNYASLRVKPKLILDVDEKEMRVKDSNLVLAYNNEVRLTANIQKKSTRAYNGELTATFIFIGDNERSIHETIVKKYAVKFNLEKEKTLTRNAAFATEGHSFLKSAHHSYEGYLIVITDSFGEMVSAESNPSSYERYAEKLLLLDEGVEFDKTFSLVDLNSEKTARAEAAEPKTWLYGMGRGDVGIPQKSPDGIVARVQTRNKEAFLMHFRRPINILEMAKDQLADKEINVVATFKLTGGKIGVSGSDGNSRRISMNDEEIHVLKIISTNQDVQFTLDGAIVNDIMTKGDSKPSRFWHFAVEVDEKSRMELTALDYQK